MQFIVYNIETTRIENRFSNQTSAKRSCTCANKRAGLAKYAVTDAVTYELKYERKVERTNLMTGEKFMESINTPYHCSPCSESYWSS